MYASWCKTCAVFDTRYRKLASQLGDTYNPTTGSAASTNTNTNTNINSGRVRFAEMRYDDPNNEEMCRLLNATKLPYILIYKGSRGKVSDFQCGPATFQLLIDEIGKYADVNTNVDEAEEGAGDDAAAAFPSPSTSFGVEEQEWSVAVQEKARKQQQQRLEQRSATYGGVGSITNYQPPNSSSSSSNMERLKRKEEEITRLYTELTNLRRNFDRVIVRMKEEHLSETNKLNEELRDQTKQYDNERQSLLGKIENLSRQMDDQDKAMIVSQQLQNEIQKKEAEYTATVSNLNSRITELETNLSKSNNELQYTITTNTNNQQQLSNHISALECRILDLEKELIEEKRAVVASTEEASRVLIQLERIKSSEDEERKVLASRVLELEGTISQLENQLLYDNSNKGSVSEEIQMQVENVRREKDAELDMLRTRVTDLEQELEWNEKTSLMDDDNLSVRSVNELRKENEQLIARISLLEKEIGERDKVIRTSNKATDILLDEMKAQKHEYEQELSRMSALVNDLENAIDMRVEEMSILQERFIALEGLVEDMKQQRNVDLDNAAANANAIQFARETERKARSQQQQPQEQPGRMGTSSFGQSQNPFGALFGGIKDMTSFGWASSEESMESYEQLRDVLSPDEVSQRRDPSMPRSGAGRVDNVREAPGMSRGDAQPFTYDSTRNSGTAGRYDNIRDGAGSASSFGGVNTPSPAVIQATTGLPTPALAFERRLAENPIVPTGAFGGSKPTSSFFSKSGASVVSAPSDTPEYYQNVISNFNNNIPAPAMPPAASFDQRPTAPVPRVGSATTGMTENIYAGAGSASTYPRPAPARQEAVPTAPLPTPALAFERRLAENPIVPSGAFGGSKPTAHFFSQKSTLASSSNEERVGDYSSSQSPYPPMDDDQAKWQSLDDFEKKRVAAEAYNSFQKSLEDSRRSTQLKPKGGSSTMGLGIGARTGGGVGGSDRARKPIATAETKNISQIELERKKHQDMVKASVAANEKGMAMPSMTAATSLPKGTVQPRQLNTQQIQASATQASARRLSLAERAKQADQDRRDREKRIKAEARQSQEVLNVVPSDGGESREEIKKNDESKRPEINLTAATKAKSIEDAKRANDVKKLEDDRRRAEELKRNAEANLAAASRAKAEAAVKPRSELKSSVSIGVAVAASENVNEEMFVRLESSQAKETIEAALLGAMVVEDSTPLPGGNSESQVKEKAIDRTAEKAKYLVRKALVAGGAAPKYDVVITKNSKNDIDMSKLLEGSGSLKDLLGQPPKRRRKGNENY